MANFLEKTGLDVLWKKLTNHPLSQVKGLDHTLEITSEGNLTTTGESPFIECTASEFSSYVSGNSLATGKIYKVTTTGHGTPSRENWINRGVEVVILVTALGPRSFQSVDCPVESVGGSNSYRGIYVGGLTCDVAVGTDPLSGNSIGLHVRKMKYKYGGRNVSVCYDFINVAWLRTAVTITDIASATSSTEQTYDLFIGSPETVPTDGTAYAYFPAIYPAGSSSSSTYNYVNGANLTIPDDKIIPIFSGFSGKPKDDVEIDGYNMVIFQNMLWADSLMNVRLAKVDKSNTAGGYGFTMVGYWSQTRVTMTWAGRSAYMVAPRTSSLYAPTSLNRMNLNVEIDYATVQLIGPVFDVKLQNGTIVWRGTLSHVKTFGTNITDGRGKIINSSFTNCGIYGFMSDAFDYTYHTVMNIGRKDVAITVPSSDGDITNTLYQTTFENCNFSNVAFDVTSIRNSRFDNMYAADTNLSTILGTTDTVTYTSVNQYQLSRNRITAPEFYES